MKGISTWLVLLVFIPAVKGEVGWTIYEDDEETPFNGRDIMVGTQLAIIIHSDSSKLYWFGSLGITEDNRNYGVLSARGPYIDPNGWTGSIYPAAGEDPFVYDWISSDPVQGYDFCTGWDAIAGNWFIIDYTALKAGNCQIGFYDGYREWNDPSETITIHQLPDCDLYDDGYGIVNLKDYAVFASHWLDTDCVDPGWCEKADLNQDHEVDFLDVFLFTRCWLVEK